MNKYRDKWTTTYDENGNIVRLIHEDDRGSIVCREYDKNGKLISAEGEWRIKGLYRYSLNK